MSPQDRGALDAIAEYRKAYSRLHDFLSDMIEGGRLTETDIPDDYAALVSALEDAARAEAIAYPADIGTQP